MTDETDDLESVRSLACGPTSGDKAQVLADAAQAISSGDLESARRTLAERYPFAPSQKSPRKYTDRQMLRIVYRDGFIDRYSGIRLVHPAALRLFSVLLPDEFPAHPNWLMSRSHFGFWELFPTIDHLHPVARGGADSEDNWVSTSMLRNSAKAHWTLEELGWVLHPPGDHAEWDGLTEWFIHHMESDPTLTQNPYLKRWYHASVEVRAAVAPAAEGADWTERFARAENATDARGHALHAAAGRAARAPAR